MASQETVRILVRCDCCGVEGMGTIISDVNGLQLEIRARRHGEWHTLTLDMAVLAQFDVQQYCIVARQECVMP